MSDDLTGDDADVLAAEYVLGTLDADERTAARRLLTEDREFAAKVRQWERRLGELHLMVEPVQPQSRLEIWQRISAGLTSVPSEPSSLQVKPGTEPSAAPELSATPEYLGPPEPPGAPAPEPAPTPEPPSAPEPQLGSELIPAPEPPVSLESVPPVQTEAQAAASEAPPEAEPIARPIVEGSSEPSPEGAAATEPAPSTPVPRNDDLPPMPMPPAPTLEPWPLPSGQTQAAAAALKPSPAVTLKPAVEGAEQPAVPIAAESSPTLTLAPERDDKLRKIERRLFRWRAMAVLLTVAVIAAGGLLALWRYEPERVPPVLRPLKLMRMVGITIEPAAIPREPAPPESQFDE
jgi:anti-sigma-K factor RskA